MRNRRRLAASGWAILAVCAVLVLKWDGTIDVPQDRIVAVLPDILPVTISRSGVTIVVNSATFALLESENAHVTAMMDLEGFGFSGTTTADLTTGITYSRGDIFFTNLMVAHIGLIPDEEVAADVAPSEPVTTGLLGSAFDRLSTRASREGGALAQIRSAAIEKAEKSLPAAIEGALRDAPVYSLRGRGLKHTLASYMIGDITFTSRSVLIDLYPARLILSFIMMCILLASLMVARSSIRVRAYDGSYEICKTVVK